MRRVVFSILVVFLVTAVASWVILNGNRPAHRTPSPSVVATEAPSSSPAVVTPIPAMVRPNEAASVDLAVPVPAPLPAALAPTPSAVARLTDPARPEAERLADLQALVRAGEVAPVLEVAGGDSYLAPAAIEALSPVRTPQVRRFLEQTCGHADAKHVAAALKALSAQGAEAVPVIARTLAANRSRPDGHEDLIAASGVAALAATGAEAAVEPLARQLTEVVGTTLGHTHGMEVVEALAALRRPAAVPALTAYAGRLQRERDASTDNPMGRTYLDGLAARVQAVITTLSLEKRP